MNVSSPLPPNLPHQPQCTTASEVLRKNFTNRWIKNHNCCLQKLKRGMLEVIRKFTNVTIHEAIRQNNFTRGCSQHQHCHRLPASWQTVGAPMSHGTQV